MGGGSLPSSFNSARRGGGASHVAHRNESMAYALRYAALETESLRLRDKLGSKYSLVSPRVLPPVQTTGPVKFRTLSPPHSSANAESQELEDAEVAAQLVMPQQQHLGQLVCAGDACRQYDRNKEQTVLSAWNRLNVPRRVLEAHDVFVMTAGRVKPYATITQSPRRPQHEVKSEEDTNVVGAPSPPEPGVRRSGRRGVCKGLSTLKSSSSVVVNVACVAAPQSDRTTPRSSRIHSKKPSDIKSSPPIPELAQSCEPIPEAVE